MHAFIAKQKMSQRGHRRGAAARAWHAAWLIISHAQGSTPRCRPSCEPQSQAIQVYTVALSHAQHHSVFQQQQQQASGGLQHAQRQIMCFVRMGASGQQMGNVLMVPEGTLSHEGGSAQHLGHNRLVRSGRALHLGGQELGRGADVGRGDAVIGQQRLHLLFGLHSSKCSGQHGDQNDLKAGQHIDQNKPE